MNCMKSTLSLFAQYACLLKIGVDLKPLERLIEDKKRSISTKDLPGGYKLIQDVSTIFGSSFSRLKKFSEIFFQSIG